MFRVVVPPIIRSAYNCIYSIWYLSHRYCYLPLSWKSWNWVECAVGGLSHCWIYIGILLGAHYILHISTIRVKSFLHPSRFRATTFQFLYSSLATSSSTPSSQSSLSLPLGSFHGFLLPRFYFFVIKRFMVRDGRAQLQALFLKSSNLKNSSILQPQFNNIKPALADGALYGISALDLLLFIILLRINPLSYTLSSIFFTFHVFIFVTIFLFFYEYLFTFYGISLLLLL